MTWRSKELKLGRKSFALISVFAAHGSRQTYSVYLTMIYTVMFYLLQLIGTMRRRAGLSDEEFLP